jgi:diguanylate cyclase (GGDEF)-like protein/PAS domain S-box-containing protein
MILRWGTEGQVIFANEAFKRCFNLAGDRLDIQNILSLIHPADTEQLLQRLTALGADLPEQETEFRLLKLDGEVRWLHWNNRAILNKERQLTEIQSVGRDITDIKRDEEELRQSYKKLAQTVNSLEHHNREITLISEMGDLLQSCLHIEEANEVFSQFARQLFPDFSGALFLFDAERNILEATASWGENLQTEHEFLARDCWAMRRGRPYVIENTEADLLCDHINRVEPKSICPYQCVPMIAQGETLGMLYLQESCLENTEILANQGPLAVMVAERMGTALSNMKLRETIKYQASYDSISGLLNRQVLEETLNQELHSAANKHQSLVVLLLDINRFDRYNMTYGFDIGDLLLSEIGALMQKNSSKTEIPFRRGGDQFALLMLNSTFERAQQRALGLQDDINRLKIMAGGRYTDSVTIRFGMAGFPKDGSTATALLHAAEQALIH